MSESLPPSAPAGAPLAPDQERMWAGLAHLGGIIWFIPALIIWLVFKQRSAFVGVEALKALNFQITLTAAWVAVQILNVVFLPGFLAWLLGFAIWIVLLIFSIQGFLSAQKGQPFKYPFSLDLVK